MVRHHDPRRALPSSGDPVVDSPDGRGGAADGEPESLEELGVFLALLRRDARAEGGLVRVEAKGSGVGVVRQCDGESVGGQPGPVAVTLVT